MLFNSYVFIFQFLPLTLLIFYFLGRYKNNQYSLLWLVLASFFFYGWWNPIYLTLLVASIIVNYSISLYILKQVHIKKLALIVGVTFNLGLLAYFKYSTFVVKNLNSLFGQNIVVDQVVLPLAISFFTFQQVAYLVDCYNGKTFEYNFLNYCLFVSFFPQLIAGPIVHHQQVMPQLSKNTFCSPDFDCLGTGAIIFTIGLCKKVLIADSLAVYASPYFNMVDSGASPIFVEAWLGSLAFTFQLYFDFSGYSDMAIGLALMFGIRLPINFNSPYKAESIVDFWRRWHITLSSFLRDYLYIKLGGNRKGQFQTYRNIFITMVLGGLWHGAGWTFVIWGTCHGVAIVVNHIWISLKDRVLCLGRNSVENHSSIVSKLLGRGLTFLVVTTLWVLFKSESLESALRTIRAMFGMNCSENTMPLDAGSAYSKALAEKGLCFGGQYSGVFPYYQDVFGLLILCAIVCFFMPNTQEVVNMKSKKLVLNGKYLVFNKFSIITGVVMSITLIMVIFQLTRVTEFLYFQF